MPELSTETLPLLPLTSGVVLPGMVVTATLETPESRSASSAAGDTGGHLLLVPKVDGRYATVGTVAKIENAGELPNGQLAVVVRGLHRARIGAGVAGTGTATWVEVEPIDDPPATERAMQLAREYRAVVENILEARGAAQVAELLRGMTDPGQIADTAVYSPDLSFEQKVEVLEAVDVEQRLEKVLAWARDTLGEVELKDRIRKDVSEGMEKSQREFILRQQLAAIRKELGEGTDGESPIDAYRAKVEEGKMPEAVREAVEREIGRLERTSEQSPEHGWIRTWLDTMTELPWGEKSTDALDIAEARRVLDADHTGLEDVKDRILEYLAVRKLRRERGLADQGGRGAGAIIALVGPPGVGKTSLGESVARAMGRKFVRVALGGVRDEAGPRPRRTTWRPAGRCRAIKEAGTMNPCYCSTRSQGRRAGAANPPRPAEVLDRPRTPFATLPRVELSRKCVHRHANVVGAPGPLLDAWRSSPGRYTRTRRWQRPRNLLAARRPDRPAATR